MPTHTFVSNKLVECVSCCCFCLYLSPQPLSSPSFLSLPSTPDFPNPVCWISLTFSSLLFSLFTIKDISPFSSSQFVNETFLEPRLLAFARDDTSTTLISVNIIVDPTRLVPEPNLNLSDSLVNEWFCIPFQYTISFICIRSPYPSERFTLYGLTDLILFCPIIISTTQIRS